MKTLALDLGHHHLRDAVHRRIRALAGVHTHPIEQTLANKLLPPFWQEGGTTTTCWAPMSSAAMCSAVCCTARG
jgi:hypothetical protein